MKTTAGIKVISGNVEGARLGFYAGQQRNNVETNLQEGRFRPDGLPVGILTAGTRVRPGMPQDVMGFDWVTDKVGNPNDGGEHASIVRNMGEQDLLIQYGTGDRLPACAGAGPGDFRHIQERINGGPEIIWVDCNANSKP